MEVLRFIKNKLIINPFKYLAVFVAGLAFSAGLVFAWNAVWHGTDWIQSGAVVDAQKVGENFEYLKNQIEDLKNQITNLKVHIQNIVDIQNKVHIQTGRIMPPTANDFLLGDDWDLVMIDIKHYNHWSDDGEARVLKKQSGVWAFIDNAGYYWEGYLTPTFKCMNQYDYDHTFCLKYDNNGLHVRSMSAHAPLYTTFSF